MTRRARQLSCSEIRTGRAYYFGFGGFRYAG